MKLTEHEEIVLNLVEIGAERGGIDIEQAIEIFTSETATGKTQFFKAMAGLKRKKLITGDVILGFYRTNRPRPAQ